MKLFAQYKVTNSTKITCPLCREDWGPMAVHLINDDCKGKASLRKSCATPICSTCTTQVRGAFFRCVECSLFGQGMTSVPSRRKGGVGTGESAPPTSPSSLIRPLVILDGAMSSSAVGASQCTDHTTDTQPPRRKNTPSPLDFCQRCFTSISREHAKHHFLTSSSNAQLVDFMWDTARNPRAPQQCLEDRVLHTLQHRDLVDEDYDFLLSLDRPQGVTVQNCLLESLRVPRGGGSTASSLVAPDGQCWCVSTRRVLGGGGGGDTSTAPSVRELPCGHVCHDTCLLELLDEALSEGPWKLDDVKCKQSGCEYHIFRGLSRRRVKKKCSTGPGIESGVGDLTTGGGPHASGEVSILLSGIAGVGIGSRSLVDGPVSHASVSGVQRVRQDGVAVSVQSRGGGNERASLDRTDINMTVSNGIAGNTSALPPRIKRGPRHLLTPATRKGLALSGHRHGPGGRGETALDGDTEIPALGAALTLRRSGSLENPIRPGQTISSADGPHRQRDITTGPESITASVGAQRSVSASRAERDRHTSSPMTSRTRRALRMATEGGHDPEALESSFISGVALQASTSIYDTSFASGGHGSSSSLSGANLASRKRNSRIARGRTTFAGKGSAATTGSENDVIQNCMVVLNYDT